MSVQEVVLQSLQPSGSLTRLMNELVKLERLVDDASGGQLLVYRWRPRGTPQLDQGGAIYNWLAPSPHSQYDLGHAVDRIVIYAHVGIPHDDENEQQAKLERYVDFFRGIVDPALFRPQPLNGAVKRAQRLEARMIEDTFGDTPILAIRMPIECELLRNVPGLT